MQPFIVVGQVLGQGSKAILPEKPHREPGGIGGQAQHIESGGGIQKGLVPPHRLPLCQLVEGAEQVAFGIGGVKKGV